MEQVATIAVYSLKGGVGKTTIAVNLAWCSARLSARRTLLWDLDPQAAATWLLDRGPAGDRASAMFSREVAPAKRIARTAYDRLDLIGADASLRDLDRLFADLDRKKRLTKLIGTLGGYDRVLLDCPPGLAPTAEQAMRAADLIVVPVVPSPLSARVLDMVERHVEGRTPLLPVHAMVDRRRRLHREALAAHPGWPAIPMASAIEAMGEARAPVGATGGSANDAFAALWREIERRLAG